MGAEPGGAGITYWCSLEAHVNPFQLTWEPLSKQQPEPFTDDKKHEPLAKSGSLHLTSSRTRCTLQPKP
jgi:hypothetical protein